MQRVIAYIDGFNLYFGLKAGGWRDLYWVNIDALSARLLKPDQQLVRVNYFTSRISGPPDKARRQARFIEALETLPSCRVHYGHFLTNARSCRRCGFTEQIPTEKMTDVNIAVELLTDAFQNGFDTALLVSADSDLTAPLQAVRRLFPAKRVIVALPPQRFSAMLRRAAHGYIHIERSHLAASQFPDRVVKPDGYVLHRPKEWQ
jgi:uncharacterized LabA/DUF88 family protein